MTHFSTSPSTPCAQIAGWKNHTACSAVNCSVAFRRYSAAPSPGTYLSSLASLFRRAAKDLLVEAWRCLTALTGTYFDFTLRNERFVVNEGYEKVSQHCQCSCCILNALMIDTLFESILHLVLKANLPRKSSSRSTGEKWRCMGPVLLRSWGI